MARLRPKVDHERLVCYVEHMKGVYQRTIDKHAASGRMDGRDLSRVRNHLECLSMIQRLLTEHSEMANGVALDCDSMGFQLETIASLIKPNGEVLLIPRRRGHHG